MDREGEGGREGTSGSEQKRSRNGSERGWGWGLLGRREMGSWGRESGREEVREDEICKQVQRDRLEASNHFRQYNDITDITL